LELWLRTYLEPETNFEIFEFDYEGKHIALLRIPPAKSEPTNSRQKSFVRVGSHKIELRKYPDWMRIIYNSQEDWSAKMLPAWMNLKQKNNRIKNLISELRREGKGTDTQSEWILVEKGKF
jgi:predicted HTH transcriptional regulator